ncbi:hypothetical protein HK097_003929, partial [Rhizophlyctis rosea]
MSDATARDKEQLVNTSEQSDPPSPTFTAPESGREANGVAPAAGSTDSSNRRENTDSVVSDSEAENLSSDDEAPALQAKDNYLDEGDVVTVMPPKSDSEPYWLATIRKDIPKSQSHRLPDTPIPITWLSRIRIPPPIKTYLRRKNRWSNPTDPSSSDEESSLTGSIKTYEHLEYHDTIELQTILDDQTDDRRVLATNWVDGDVLAVMSDGRVKKIMTDKDQNEYLVGSEDSESEVSDGGEYGGRGRKRKKRKKKAEVVKR